VYVSFFGFREKPFNLTPDPKYLYLSSRHQEALAHLEFCRRERGGFVLLTGEVGAGKTTVARHFLAHLDEHTATAVVLYPALSASELLASVLRDLQVRVPEPATLKTLVDQLHAFLLTARAEGRGVMLLIDEAQDLAPDVLEQIRLISNLETDTEKLIQIVLMGQPELIDVLSRPDLRQLAQRITARYHLTGLSRDECSDYIRHRLVVAGGEGKVTFAPAALNLVHRTSAGIPRVVNLVCDRALLAGYVEAQRTISAEYVLRAAREIAGAAPRQRRDSSAWRRVGLTAAGVLLGGAALFAAQWALTGWRDPAVVTSRAPAPTTASPTPGGTAETARSAPLTPLLLTLGRTTSYRGAVETLRSQWNTPITLTALDSHLEQIRLLDLPVALEMAHPARRDTCFLALLRLERDRATVAAGPAAQADVDTAEIERHWTRRALVAWPQDRASTPQNWSRAALARLGYALSDPAQDVVLFQKRFDLVPDGQLGPRTLLALFSRSEGDRPRLRRVTP
jgi:general secretion pathway protein A